MTTGSSSGTGTFERWSNRRTPEPSSTGINLGPLVFGPVFDDTGSWGLGVVEAEDENELRAFAAGDPVVTTGTGDVEVGKMLAGFVRPR
jgi:YCII-related domain